MSCYHPIPAFRTPDGVVFKERSGVDILGRLDLPCGQCIGCRMRRASDWQLRIMHEAQFHDANSFVTVTYDQQNLPERYSLRYRDVQLWLKRLRRYYVGRTIRFYVVGEYGGQTSRPHYHACLFGVDFRSDRVVAGKSSSGQLFYESALLTQLWRLGRCSVQDLTPETAGYCSRYILTKALGKNADEARKFTLPDGEVVERVPEFARMSLRGGIGSDWFDRYHRDVFPHDFVVAGGAKRRAPRYYDTLLDRKSAEVLEAVKEERAARARLHVAEQSDERLRVRELVHEASMSQFRRGLE